MKLLDYQPKHVTSLDDSCTRHDGVQLIEFRRKGDFTASIEFGNYFNKKMNGFYFYFETVDWSGTSDGDFISLQSGRRKDVLYFWPKTEEEYEKAAKHVNAALRKLYRRKRKND